MGKISIGKKILSANEEYALQNASLLAEHGSLCLNMISSPGSGKTSILVRTITELKNKSRIGVIEGDIRTDIDAQRIRAAKAPVVQINTEGACHLSAVQINRALKELPLRDLDLIIIENVGNLICPSAFSLGETHKVVVLSVAEGDDKPAKYPAIFAKSKVLLINKIDLLEVPDQVNFDINKVKKDSLRLNKKIEIFPVSAKTGDGFKDWLKWLMCYPELLKN
ncbi:MAG: hydrogenase nickel incorporation protein HypB [Planctomycetota bacterium]